MLALYRERNGEDEYYEQIKSLANRAIDANSKRDLLVHSDWYSAGSPVKATRVKSTAKQKHGYKTTVENWDLPKFEELTNEFISIHEDGWELLQLLKSKNKAFNFPVYEGDPNV